MAFEEFDILNPPMLSMTTQEILDDLERLARERFGVSAKEFIQMYRDGTLGCCPGEHADMLAYFRLIPQDHEILAEPKTKR